ncbi:MAG: PucR family transcriptional regulator [Oscillospiraceae bacterium]
MALTLKQLLVQMHSNDLKCVAGFKGLDREIIGFSILDTPEILSWLKGGEILVSAGYVMRNNPSLLKTLVRDLHERGCVGLGIKRKRYYDEVPRELIEQGDLYDFPIFEIPYEIRFSDLSSAIYRNIFQFSLTTAERINHVYQHILKTVLSDASTEHMLYDISCSVPNPLILLDRRLNLIAYEVPEDNCKALSDYLCLSTRKPIFDIETTKRLLDAYEDMHYKAYSIKRAHSESEIGVALFSIMLEGENQGFLAIPETVEALNTEHYEILDSITSIIGIHFLKRGFQESREGHNGDDFVNNVLLSTQGIEEDIKYYCNLYDFPVDLRRVCVNLHIADYRNLPYDKRNAISNMVITAQKSAAEDLNLPHFDTQFEEGFFSFLFFGDKAEYAQITLQATELARKIQKKIEGYGIPAEVGMSDCLKGAGNITQTFRQSIDIVSLGRRVEPAETVHRFDNLHVYYMLASAMSRSELRDLYEDTIAALDVYDAETGGDYVKTLDRFIANRFNVSKAAQEVHVHRNTMINKLEKLRGLLPLDMDNPEDILRLQLGLHAKVLLDTNDLNVHVVPNER